MPKKAKPKPAEDEPGEGMWAPSSAGTPPAPRCISPECDGYLLLDGTRADGAHVCENCGAVAVLDEGEATWGS